MITQERLDELRNEIGHFVISGHDISDVLDEIDRLRSLVPPAELMEEAAQCLESECGYVRESSTGVDNIITSLRDYAQRINQSQTTKENT